MPMLYNVALLVGEGKRSLHIGFRKLQVKTQKHEV